ncbi:MAG: HlyD family type I secretion periplasmic adaptor subunit [Immundisolibacterales bacterium]|nr:HlyD family type I secretion periplasmic adaptor subunit [Immundisolibacterales bacterium]
MRIVAILGLLLVTAAAVSWAARIDIVAPTRGEVVARERTREVQALVTGVVAALHVEEGVHVRKGALLVELDDAIVGSEIRRIEAEILAASHAARRLRLPGRATVAGVAGRDERPERRPGPQPSRIPADSGWDLHRRLADLEGRRLAAALREAEARVGAARSRLASVEAERRLVGRLLPVIREQVDGLEALSVRSHASRHDYLRELSRLLELEGRAESLALAGRGEEEELGRLQSAARLLRHEHDTARQRELVEVELALAKLREDLVQARRRFARHRVASPVAGVVQDVGELAAGSFVRPGDRLMAVVPVGGGLEVRAYVRNRDVGFVKAGQEAIVKIDAFPFTRYGTTEGVVDGVSLDAVGGSGSGSPDAGADEIGAGYLARISLRRPTIEIDGAVVPLRPGMHAAVDIRTGRRRFIEYVIAPVVAYGSNAFRER